MKKQNGLMELLVVTFMLVIVFAVIFVVFKGFQVWHTDEEGAARILTLQNYKNVVIDGYRWTGCGHNDFYQTGFSATAPNGQPVQGVVCKGWSRFGKAATVRIDGDGD